MNIYIAVSLICSFLATIILCRYYRLFFGSSRISAAAEMICYFVLFLINTVVYLKINIPLIILSVNIVTRFLITYLYDGKLRHRILLSLFFCIIAALIEAAVVFLFTYTPIRIDAANQYSLIHIFGAGIFHGISCVVCFDPFPDQKTKHSDQTAVFPLDFAFGDSSGFFLPDSDYYEL